MKIKLVAAISLIAAFLLSASVPTVAESEIISDELTYSDNTATMVIEYETLDELERPPFPQFATDDEGGVFTLAGVEYEVTQTETSRFEYVYQDETYKALYEKEIPETAVYVNPVNGKEYELPLIGAKYTGTMITGRSGTVYEMIEYGWQTYLPKPVQQLKVNHYDALSGQTLTGTVYLSSFELEEQWRWVDDVEVPIQFEIYEAEYYRLHDQDVFIPYSGENPPVYEGFELEIYKVLQLDPDRHRIYHSMWLGETYTEDGVEYRDGLLFASRFAAQYVAYYQAEWNLPDAPGYDCEASYSAKIDVLDGTPLYTITATATYEKTSVPLAGYVVAGVVLVAIAVVVVLVILARRKNKKNAKTPAAVK